MLYAGDRTLLFQLSLFEGPLFGLILKNDSLCAEDSNSPFGNRGKGFSQETGTQLTILGIEPYLFNCHCFKTSV